MTSPEWDEIYRTYHDRVMGYIAARVQRREDAEDLCADVFEKVFKKLGEYDRKKASVSTWIYTITRNTVIDFFRKSRPAAELDENMPSEQEVDENLLKREILHELGLALKNLPPDLQNVIVLVYGERKTLLEVSRMTHVSYRTTKLRHQKALRMIREQIQD